MSYSTEAAHTNVPIVLLHNPRFDIVVAWVVVKN